MCSIFSPARLFTATGVEKRLTRSDSCPALFHNAVTSLGTYGCIFRLTLSCVDIYALRETIAVMSIRKVKSGHEERLDKFRHVKYHYIPHTDRVVVYTYEEVEEALIGKEEGKNFKGKELKNNGLNIFLMSFPKFKPRHITGSRLRS